MIKINKDIAFDIFLRLLSCFCIAFFIANLLSAYAADKTRLTLVAAVISEVATIIVSLVSRRPAGRDWHPLTILATLYAGILWQPLLSVGSVTHLVNDSIGLFFQGAAIIWVINAKVTLGRSFGWLPANRGVVDNGVYRVVRHPIYFGYAVSHLGLLLSNWNLWNAAVMILVYVAQVYRIFQEEKFLLQDPEYCLYAGKVPYRLIYGVF